MKLEFAAEQKSPTLEIGVGEYRRRFDAKDQPFECEQEEAKMLLRSGHFEEVKEQEQAAGADDTTSAETKSEPGAVATGSNAALDSPAETKAKAAPGRRIPKGKIGGAPAAGQVQEAGAGAGEE